jgi:predicted RNase H-related nuclease YkuK (DUF458 family)
LLGELFLKIETPMSVVNSLDNLQPLWTIDNLIKKINMNYKTHFKKFGGEQIPDIIEYLKEILEREPTATISVGCDSIQVRRRTIYAVTIMTYNTDLKNGAHVVFFRESCPKIRDTQERLYKEAQYLHDVGEFINGELEPFYIRKDITDMEIRRYKYHLLKSAGEYSEVALHNEEGVMKNLTITDTDRVKLKEIDLHVDFNPFPGISNRNKSNIAYRSYVPWLRSIGFRVWCKPESHGATTAADLLCKK